MAVEQARGCGYRTVGGLYLVGSGLAAPCDRLPIPVTTCPTCGEGIKFLRGAREINAHKLWGSHPSDDERMASCTDPSPSGGHYYCFVCFPPEGPSYLMGVGEKFYSPQEFVFEAQKWGVSKRIPAVPKNLIIGQSIVYLVHKQVINLGLGEDGKAQYQAGVFYAFKPTALEIIITDLMAKDEKLVESLEKRGLTPVIVPHDDKDHQPRRGRSGRILEEVKSDGDQA